MAFTESEDRTYIEPETEQEESDVKVALFLFRISLALQQGADVQCTTSIVPRAHNGRHDALTTDNHKGRNVGETSVHETQT